MKNAFLVYITKRSWLDLGLEMQSLGLGLNTMLDLRLGLERILKSWSYLEINLLSRSWS